MLIDVRVAGAIARQSNSLTMAAGTARLTTASQLMATATAALLGAACLSMRRLRGAPPSPATSPARDASTRVRR